MKNIITSSNKDTDKKKPPTQKLNVTKKEKANDDGDTLKINEEFAKKFTYQKKREVLEKAKNKYGKDFMKIKDDASEDSEEDISEDSDGELINPKVMTKFLDTYIRLKDDKMVKEFLVDKKEIFDDEDFIFEKKNKNRPEYTVKDALINYKQEDEADAGEEAEDIYSINYKVKSNTKEDLERKEFLSKANQEESTGGLKFEDDDDDFVDDGFLKIKPNSTIEIVDEEEQDDASMDEKAEPKEIKNPEEILQELNLEDALKKAKIKPENLNMKLLQKIWGDDKINDKKERFLRNYILSEAWLENDENKIKKKLLFIDREDEAKDEIFDDFESKYNHRFEEQGGANITTYSRNINESYRIKDDSRKEKRQQRELRKETEKNQIKSELQMARDIKKEEIKNKINVIERIAGTDKIKELIEDLENEFDAKKFDEKMNKIFNEEYYGNKDNTADITQAIVEKSFDYKTNRNIPDKERLKKLERLETGEDDEAFEENGEAYEEENVEANEPINEENPEEYYEYNENEENQYDEEGADPSGNNQWFYCDNCKKAIKENKIKYECETCEDYVTCRDCFKANGHSHKMKKSKVPTGCRPPDNWKELLENLDNAQAEPECLACTSCKGEIISSYYYVCEECKELKICKTCRGIGKSIHEHKLKKFLIETDVVDTAETLKDPKERLSSLIDNAYDKVTDDVIAGHIATKFSYIKVDQDNSGLTDEMILFLDDNTLNKFIPLKKLAPHREKVSMGDWQRKKMMSELIKELDRKKKEFYRMNKQAEDVMENNNNKFLNKKRQFNKVDSKDFRKQKRLETYGIDI